MKTTPDHVAPLEYETAEDYSCHKRWRWIVAIVVGFVAGFLLLFKTPTNVVECSPTTDNYCSRYGTRETPHLYYAIPAVILILASLVLSVVVCRRWKKDRRNFKKAQQKVEREEQRLSKQKELERLQLEKAVEESMEGLESAQTSATTTDTTTTSAVKRTVAPLSPGERPPNDSTATESTVPQMEGFSPPPSPTRSIPGSPSSSRRRQYGNEPPPRQPKEELDGTDAVDC